MVISASHGRSTRTFRRLRAQLLAENTTCAICGHDDADSVDHIIARSIDPTAAEDPDNLQPAHHQPCPTCGQRCQRVKGTRPMATLTLTRTSRTW